LTFSDNGIGFENEFPARSLRSSSACNGRSEYEGSGIGLAICKEDHGAPWRDHLCEGNPGNRGNIHYNTTGMKTKHNILIVDDDADDREIIKDAFLNSGMATNTFSWRTAIS
jgi:hypothetical protein